MKCPKCGDRTEVLQTTQLSTSTARRRRCWNPGCLHRFVSREFFGATEPVMQVTSDEVIKSLTGKSRKPGSTFDPEAVAAAITVDRRRAQIKREQRAKARSEYEETGLYVDEAPKRLDRYSLRNELEGY